MGIHTNSSSRLRIAIVARLDGSGANGDMEQFVMSLVNGLGRLTDGEEEYLLLTNPAAPHWLDHLIGPNQRVMPWVTTGRERWTPVAGKCSGPLRPAAQNAAHHLFTWVSSQQPSNDGLPSSHDFFEHHHVDVVHFPYQRVYSTSVPSIFNPHDLQHYHFPQFFSARTVAERDRDYRLACQMSSRVVVASQWVKDDLRAQLGVAADKIHVIPDANPTEMYRDSSSGSAASPDVLQDLPSTFILYPAQTWPHKNHLRLLEALAYNRDYFGVVNSLICTGRQSDYWPAIREKLPRITVKPTSTIPRICGSAYTYSTLQTSPLPCNAYTPRVRELPHI